MHTWTLQYGMKNNFHTVSSVKQGLQYWYWQAQQLVRRVVRDGCLINVCKTVWLPCLARYLDSGHLGTTVPENCNVSSPRTFQTGWTLFHGLEKLPRMLGKGHLKYVCIPCLLSSIYLGDFLCFQSIWGYLYTHLVNCHTFTKYLQGLVLS